MPVEFAFLQEGGVLVTGTGVVNGAEIVAVNDALYETPEKVAAIRYQICDLTEVEDIVLTGPEVRKLADQDSRAGKFSPNMIIAVVASKDVIYGLARMWDSTVDEKAINTRVFRSRQDADAWIELELARQDHGNTGSGNTEGSYRGG